MVKVFRSLIYTRNYGESINPVHEYKVNTTRSRLPSTARRLHGAGRGNPPPIHAQFSCTIGLVTAPLPTQGLYGPAIRRALPCAPIALQYAPIAI